MDRVLKGEKMSDQWMIRGREFSNCNCSKVCPCQFSLPSTDGLCEAVAFGHIEEGHFNETRLDGLNWALIVKWPGEIAEGNGRQQAFIDERADTSQREALRKILHGESTAPGSTHFYVFNSTMSEVLDPVFVSMELEVDVDARKAKLTIPGLIESKGEPIINPHSGTDHRARINLPNGFEYTFAEIGIGTTTAQGALTLDLSDSYGQFCLLHMNQDGVIR